MNGSTSLFGKHDNLDLGVIHVTISAQGAYRSGSQW
jgi:hypothetical protein